MINKTKKFNSQMPRLDFSKIIYPIISVIESKENIRDKTILKKLNIDFNGLMKGVSKLKENDITWIEVDLGLIGSFDFPVMKMGKGNTLDLFTLEDLILFSYYWVKRNVSGIFVDIGANIGLHSAVAHKCGLTVVAFEPSPLTYKIGKQFLSKVSRNIKFIDPIQVKTGFEQDHSCYIEAAISNLDGVGEFVQLNENPFGNHLSGKKKSVYGSTNNYKVTLISLSHLSKPNSLIKIDAEGADADIFEALLNVRSKVANSTVFLCDWRDETRLDILNLLNANNLNLLSPLDEVKLDNLNSFPQNNSADFGLVNI